MSSDKMSDGIEAELIKEIHLENIPAQTKRYFWLELLHDALGLPVMIPVMIAKGNSQKPILGLTAAVHGDEVNGTQVIQRLFEEIDPENLQGTIVAVPVVNVMSFNKIQRKYVDGEDLNRIMPGDPEGNNSEIFAHRFLEKVISKIDYLLDLHTASFGRINSYYIRADLKGPITRKLALLQNAEILVHNKPSDGTLRGAADDMGIPAITLEVGNPNTFQKKMIRSGVQGIHNVLVHLKMIDDDPVENERKTIICKSSYWIYTKLGGVLSIHVGLTQLVEKGQHIATLRDAFGNITKEYYCPEDGVVVGKSTSPANQSGGRIIHLGIIE